MRRPPTLRCVVENIRFAEAQALLWSYNRKLWEDALPLPWQLLYYLAAVLLGDSLGALIAEVLKTIPPEEHLVRAMARGHLYYVFGGMFAVVGLSMLRHSLLR
jgi:hypothetical protein